VDINFQFGSVGKALELMLMGMVGIFVVMVVILGIVVLLNNVTDEKKAAAKKAKKEAEEAELKDNMRSI
jgi:flagellar biosynthesis/type III secretory pathway M-ring protein FliF/YscJ